MELRFLVDVNLPRNFSYFHSDAFVHVADLDPKLSDTDIWKLAKTEGRVILTRDSDFYHRSMNDPTPPKVVHFQLGNIRLKEMHEYFGRNWLIILHALQNADLIIATDSEIHYSL